MSDDEQSEKEKIEKEIIEEATKEAMEERENKYIKYYPYLSIILGLSGIFLFVPINILMGITAIILAKESIDAGYKRAGKIGGILGLLSIFSFLFRAGFMLSNLSFYF